MRRDRWARATLIGGEVLVAAGLTLRFVRGSDDAGARAWRVHSGAPAAALPPDRGLGLEWKGRRCALVWRF